MADESRELQAQMEALRREMQGLEEATKASQTGLSAFGRATTQGAKDFAKGMGGLAMQVGRGNTEFKALNTMVDITSNALAGMAKAIPFAGEAVAAGLKAAAEGAKFMLEQMDQTTRAFNDLGRAGALAADGMTGLQQQFLKSGLSLQTYTKVVGENGQALARMGGMVEGGAKAFTNITEHFTNLAGGGDDALRKLGMSSDQVGESVAAFVTQQTRLGRSQQMSQQELLAGTRAYAIELDALQKVTGMSREAIQKQQDAALSESRFRANYEELMATGREKEAKALMALQTQMTAIGPELGQATRDLASGAANTDAARKLMASTGGAAADIVERLKTGQIDQYQAAKEMQEASQRMGDAARTNAKYVDRANSSYIDFAQQADLNNARIMADGTMVKKVQDSQLNKTDDLTKTTIDAQKNMEGMNREMQKLGFTFLPEAAKATKAVTEAMKGLLDFINEKVLGKKGEGKPLPGRAVSGGGQTSAAEMGGASGGGGEAAAPASDAEIAAARKSVMAGGGGPPAVAPEDYIKFTGGTGDKAHFDQLEPGVRAQFLQMAMAYNQMTGKKLQVNSAFRSPEEQAGVNSGANPKAAPGMSLHNVGRALDIQSDQRADLERMGLLSQYGFKPLQGDPPHISAANGAILSGPMGGYKPNLTMHGTEAIVPLNTLAQQQAVTGGADNGLLAAQLEKLDELVSVMKNQLSVSTKIMQYSS